jgi:exodeoxyribonuclease VII large subunit
LRSLIRVRSVAVVDRVLFLMLEPEQPGLETGRSNAAVGLRAYLDDLAAVVRRVPSAWVRCELHALNVGGRFVKMEFIELDRSGKQTAKVQGGCWPNVWHRINDDFAAAGLALEAGSQVLVQLQGRLNPTFGFQVEVTDFDLTFALGDHSARVRAIRKHLQDTGVWGLNRSLPRPADFVRISVIAPAGAAALGDFRSTAAKLASAGLASFQYHEVPFQTREAPARIVEVLREIYRQCGVEGTQSCAVAIVRGGGASADLAWLVDQKLTEAVCRMNVPVMTGIGHERDSTLLDEVACMTFDTPSKVIEHISSTITRAALEGRRAHESIQSSVVQIASRLEAAISSVHTTVERDAREGLRLAHVLAKAEAGGLEPGARALLDDTRSAVASASVGVDRDAREMLRTAETTVRVTAAGLEPGARALLDEVRAVTANELEAARSAARRGREVAAQKLQNLSDSVTRAVETVTRAAEIGTQRASSEVRTRLEGVPRSALDCVAALSREVSVDAVRATELVRDQVAGTRDQAVRDATRALDGCLSEIAIIRARAEALHPKTVLAAGYAILRGGAGTPLVDVAAVRSANAITAEMRDGHTPLTNAGRNGKEV